MSLKLRINLYKKFSVKDSEQFEMILNVKISPKTGNMATLGLQAIGCMFQVQGVLPQGTRKLSIYLCCVDI